MKCLKYQRPVVFSTVLHDKSFIFFFTDPFGARGDTGCASSWESFAAAGASQFMFSLSYSGEASLPDYCSFLFGKPSF